MNFQDPLLPSLAALISLAVFAGVVVWARNYSRQFANISALHWWSIATFRLLRWRNLATFATAVAVLLLSSTQSDIGADRDHMIRLAAPFVAAAVYFSFRSPEAPWSLPHKASLHRREPWQYTDRIGWVALGIGASAFLGACIFTWVHGSNIAPVYAVALAVLATLTFVALNHVARAPALPQATLKGFDFGVRCASARFVLTATGAALTLIAPTSALPQGAIIALEIANALLGIALAVNLWQTRSQVRSFSLRTAVDPKDLDSSAHHTSAVEQNLDTRLTSLGARSLTVGVAVWLIVSVLGHLGSGGLTLFGSRPYFATTAAGITAAPRPEVTSLASGLALGAGSVALASAIVFFGFALWRENRAVTSALRTPDSRDGGEASLALRRGALVGDYVAPSLFAAVSFAALLGYGVTMRMTLWGTQDIEEYGPTFSVYPIAGWSQTFVAVLATAVALAAYIFIATSVLPRYRASKGCHGPRTIANDLSTPMLRQAFGVGMVVQGVEIISALRTFHAAPITGESLAVIELLGKVQPIALIIAFMLAVNLLVNAYVPRYRSAHNREVEKVAK